ncbi:MAG: helix-hairpin-helix domain-containing protein [Proteobacteria bacterium]|jgi:competence protein ComEA|nr:helix-hairpin-helix domain-containing protein [Pseudomonadota bacterium]
MLRFFRFLILALALFPMAATTAVAAKLVNINTASVATLRHVKGISLPRARAIVEYRETHGRFASVNELIRVPGITRGALNQIRPQVTVGRAYKTRHHHRRPQHSY